MDQRRGEDPWWYVAMGVLVVLLGLDVSIPVLLVAPVLTLSIETVEASAPPGQVPGPGSLELVLGGIALLLGGGLLGLSIWKIYDEQVLNSRWMWILVAAGIASLWSVLLLYMTLAFSA